MSTTTGGAPNVLNWLEEWLQTEWTDLEVYCTSVTTQWAAIAIAGPNSRRLLSELTNVDLSNDAFPFMSWQDGDVAGIPSRIFRISFSGETGFEVQCPASYAMALWRALMTAGEKFNIMPYGTEAMHVLRAEKGFVIVGQDTDGTTTPHDLGMSWIVSKKKDDFLGKRGLSRPDTLREDRKQLVGLITDDPNEVIPEGAHISPEPHAPPPVPMEGWVSSSHYSPNCGRSIALALIQRGHERIGESVAIPLEDKVVRAKIVKSVFFDEEGERLRG
jgi:sarcosine oxidase subunit alpha